MRTKALTAEMQLKENDTRPGSASRRQKIRRSELRYRLVLLVFVTSVILASGRSSLEKQDHVLEEATTTKPEDISWAIALHLLSPVRCQSE
jgi:hypothetical protein